MSRNGPSVSKREISVCIYIPCKATLKSLSPYKNQYPLMSTNRFCGVRLSLIRICICINRFKNGSSLGCDEYIKSDDFVLATESFKF